MSPRLTQEQREALTAQAGAPVSVADEQTQKVYVLVEDELHRRAMAALEQQEDRAAIQTGIEDMEAGRVVPFEEVDARIRRKLGLPPRA